MVKSLSETLAQLVASNNGRIAVLENDLQVEQTGLKSIKDQLEILQQELKIREEYILLLQEEIANQAEVLARQEQETLHLVMENCLKSLILLGEKLQLRETLRIEKQQLLQSDPDLESKFYEYRLFEQNPEAILQLLPTYHRQAILLSQEKLRTELQPYINILEQEPDTTFHEEIYFEVAISQTENSLGYTCLIPIPEDLSDFTPELRTFLEKVQNLASDGILAVTNQQDWTISGLDISDWKGFTFFFIEGTYTGLMKVTQVVQNILSTSICSSLILKEVPITCSVSKVMPLQPTNPFQVSTSLEIEQQDEIKKIPEGEVEVENSLEIESLADDILNEPGQKIEWLRKLLIHLIGYGQVGMATIPVPTLLQKIGANTEENFSNEVKELVQANILKSNSRENAAPEVSLNPAHLLDAQDLINRDVTVFWEGIINQL